MSDFTISSLRAALADYLPCLKPVDDRPRAAVAVLLYEGLGGIELLLVERAARDDDPWSGHIALPGGRVGSDGETPKSAAEREITEEVGIDISGADYLGQLDDVTGNVLPVHVSVFLYAMETRPVPRLNPEIHDAFWVPLMEIASGRRHGRKEFQVPGGAREYPTVDLLGPNRPLLWGITYRIASQLFHVAGTAFPASEEPTPVTGSDLQGGFRALGLDHGDVLFFHTSLKSFGRVVGGAAAIIDCALEVVGPSGTISVPTFVQKVNGKSATYRQRMDAWDIGSSASDVGFVTEVFRNRQDAVRSDHCCDSLAAIGAEAASAMNPHATAHSRPSPWDERAFGHGSPWDWLVERNALYLLMGVDFRVCSIFHYAQALWVEDRLGDVGDEPVWPVYHFPEMGRLVKAEGLVEEVWVGPSRWQAFRVEPCLKLVADILNSRPEMIERKPLKLYGE